MTDNMSSILKKATDLFNLEFVLCYKDPHSFNWSCETGYKTMEEVDKRTSQFPREYGKKTTTVLTTHQGTPNFLKQQWIKKQLTPTVTMHEKPQNN